MDHHCVRDIYRSTFYLRIYHLINLNDKCKVSSKRQFLFHVDIAKAQDDAFRALKIRIAEVLTPVANLIAEIRDELDKGHATFEFDELRERSVLRSRSGYSLEIVSCWKGNGGPPTSFWRELSIYEPEGKPIVVSRNIGDGPLPRNVNTYRMVLSDLVDEDQAEIARNLDAATAPGLRPEIWSYWDFVYFSTITQTTVG